MTETQIYIKLEDTLKLDFNIELAKHNHTQKDIITSAIEDYIKHKGNPSWTKNKKIK